MRESVNRETANLLSAKMDRLKQLFPEAFSEGQIDWERLRAALGDFVDDRPERYSFTWAGKRDAIRLLQMPSRATLVPCKEESVNFDTTKHLFIEGDNLEVLKLLYKSYFGQVKMIYIDPPYNTGNDFIYRDNYTDPLDTYLRLTGQKDEDGNVLTSNPETSGRYHSAWLSMMYPRLFLARQLLQNDGVIFVSIDDHEVYNLRFLMNEVFGEENHLSNLVWYLKSGTSAGHFTRAHEYIVAYAKDKSNLPNFPSSDATSIRGRTTIRPSRRNPVSQIRFPAGLRFEGGDATFSGTLGDEEPVRILEQQMVFKNGRLQSPVTLEAAWRMKRQINDWLDGKQTFDSKGQRVAEMYFNRQGIPWYGKDRGFINPKSVIEVGTTKDGTLEVERIFGQRVIEFPKPSVLLRFLVSIPAKPNESAIILDFFAGSCTTAQAVLELNREDGGNRRFIMVQLPEPTAEDSEAFKAGYTTIAEIGKERLRHVIAKMQRQNEGKLQTDRETPEDPGFKVFKLVQSNYRSWIGVPESTPEAYAEQMAMFTDPLVDGWKAENVIYEVAVKEGYGLNSRIEKVEGGNTIWSVTDLDNGQSFYICLDDKISLESLKPLVLTREQLFVCRDKALDDTAAANLTLQCRLKVI